MRAQEAKILSASSLNGSPRVSDFTQRPASETPGNVGLCFSGGGSRALSATWGQLRALEHLGLLDKAKAISSVSGGSWATVPFTFLPDSISDAEFLGTMVTRPADITQASLNVMSSKTLGYVPTQYGLGLTEMALEMPALSVEGVPADRLWTHQIGDHVLKPFGLSSFDANQNPTAFFCPDTATCKRILANNPHLKDYHVVRDSSRPFHIINTAMFVHVPTLQSPTDGFKYLAPFHATPYFAGVLPSIPGTAGDLTAQVPVGGGVVESFAFNSQFTGVGTQPGAVKIQQDCPFALSDITGASSSAFSEVLMNKVPMLHLKGLDPAFNYWSPAHQHSGQGEPTRFSDAGTLDNSGVCAMLSYSDIDNLVVFVNTAASISKDAHGTIVVDDSLPPLFGYQPYGSGPYERYPATNVKIAAEATNTEFRFNQVFGSNELQGLLNGLWKATTAGGAHPAGTAPAVYLQKGLRVLPNSWWGVQGGKSVNVLWIYNNKATQWNQQLASDVASQLPSDFPSYSMWDTHLPAAKVNLLAHFTSWVVLQQSSLISGLFESHAYGLENSGHNNIVYENGPSAMVGVTVGVVGAIFLIGLVVLGAFVSVRRIRNRRSTAMFQPLLTSDTDMEMDPVQLVVQ